MVCTGRMRRRIVISRGNRVSSALKEEGKFHTVEDGRIKGIMC